MTLFKPQVYFVKTGQTIGWSTAIYRPSDVFTVMSCCYILEDKFNYSIDSNLRNSPRVHNIVRQE